MTIWSRARPIPSWKRMGPGWRAGFWTDHPESRSPLSPSPVFAAQDRGRGGSVLLAGSLERATCLDLPQALAIAFPRNFGEVWALCRPWGIPAMIRRIFAVCLLLAFAPAVETAWAADS